MPRTHKPQTATNDGPVDGPGAEKICSTCGRRMVWRARWARSWQEVKYCGERCRRQRPARLDRELESKILELLAKRSGGSTLCPSEAARAVAPENWRSLLERTRNAARRLVARGEIEILQKGQVVDPSTARGPIRLGKALTPRPPLPKRERGSRKE